MLDKENYFKSMMRLEEFHRLFLEVIKVQTDRLHIRDITNVQCLILYSIGTRIVTVSEITDQGHYLGSNVSYNLRKMVQNEYLIKQDNIHDGRSQNVQLSAKGLVLHNKLDILFDNHTRDLKDIGFNELNNIISSIELVLKKIIKK